MYFDIDNLNFNQSERRRLLTFRSHSPTTRLTSLSSLTGAKTRTYAKNTIATSISQITRFTKEITGFTIHDVSVKILNLVVHVHDIIEISSVQIKLMVDDFTAGGPLELRYVKTSDILDENNNIIKMVGGNSCGDTLEQSGDQVDGNIYQNRAQVIDSCNSVGDQIVESASTSTKVLETLVSRPDSLKSPLASLKRGDYIYCTGYSKRSSDESDAIFIAYSVRLIQDPNEVTMHTLEVIRDSLFLNTASRQKDCDSMDLNSKKKLRPITEEKSDLEKTEPRSVAEGEKHFGEHQRELLAFMRERPENLTCGVSLSHLIMAFEDKLDEREILSHLDSLSNEGVCWPGAKENLWIADHQKLSEIN